MLSMGIIPARAGFTFPGRSGRRAGHGSSPLARGLRTLAHAHEQIVRIIPARAGFTFTRRPRISSTKDHPRSRGVYGPGDRRPVVAEGSSPLARGLRQGRHPGLHGVGIIPARAGFTASVSVSGSRPRDHPRSRGVYPRAPPTRRTRRGSSPLARGLLPRGPAESADHGIIPARAGFTGPCASSPPRGADHPRSRGVYFWPRSVISRPGRIIPARAGFTSVMLWRRGAAQDHPRSRGVYAKKVCVARISVGSSPLARGLREVAALRAAPSGIIPARAGFTIQVTGAAFDPKGSSPLARGLLIGEAVTDGCARIIPARAGFTAGW